MYKDKFTIDFTELVADTTQALDALRFRDGMIRIDAELVDVNANGTSPTLDVSIETTIDGVNWSALASAVAFTQLTDTGSEEKALTADQLGQQLRFVVDLGGSGYTTAEVDPDDNVYWNLTINAILWD